MNDNDFKITLIKALEQESNAADQVDKELLLEVVLAFPRCNLYLEETNIFTGCEWNTYQTILHIQVPLDKQELFTKTESSIFGCAKKIYGRQADHFLTHVEIGILIEHYERMDFSIISVKGKNANANPDS